MLMDVHTCLCIKYLYNGQHGVKSQPILFFERLASGIHVDKGGGLSMQEGNDRDCIAVLRDHGLQVTYQRLAIYQALLDSKDHPSAEDIYQQVRRRFPMISLGTVYKTLERFHEVKLIQRVGPLMDVARYEAKTTAHHHFICLECQTIVDLDDPTLEEKIQVPMDNGFQVLQRQVVVQGLCPHCRKD